MFVTDVVPRAEWGAVDTKPDDVECFFQRNPSFVCPRLHGRILRLYCLRRMIAPNPKTGSQGYLKGDNPLNSYCRSGQCEEGRKTVQLLKVEAEYEEFFKEQQRPKKCTAHANRDGLPTTTKRQGN